jgi:hypothetical protein
MQIETREPREIARIADEDGDILREARQRHFESPERRIVDQH